MNGYLIKVTISLWSGHIWSVSRSDGQKRCVFPSFLFKWCHVFDTIKKKKNVISSYLVDGTDHIQAAFLPSKLACGQPFDHEEISIKIPQLNYYLFILASVQYYSSWFKTLLHTWQWCDSLCTILLRRARLPIFCKVI